MTEAADAEACGATCDGEADCGGFAFKNTAGAGEDNCFLYVACSSQNEFAAFDSYAAPAAATTAAATTAAPAAAGYSTVIANNLCQNSDWGSNVEIAAGESDEDHLARCKAECDANAACSHISKQISGSGTFACYLVNEPTCTNLPSSTFETYVK
jgi:hypothetical protein